MVGLLPRTICLETQNRVVNAMGIALYGINALCMAVLAVSADKWEGTPRAKGVDTAVMIIQFVILSGELGCR